MSDDDVIEFTPDAVREYLDKAITVFRLERDGALQRDALVTEFTLSEKNVQDAYNMAVCYVDAFQSVRMSLFGETLP